MLGNGTIKGRKSDVAPALREFALATVYLLGTLQMFRELFINICGTSLVPDHKLPRS